MNKAVVRIIFVIFLIFISSCTEENITNPPPQEENNNYFPDNDGTFYKYEITVSDTSGVISSGFRTVHYMGHITIDRTPYHIQYDTVNTNLQLSGTTSYFRTTSTGVFYYIDTTGFVSLLPDSLQSSVSIQSEMRTLFFPLEQGSAWTVYRITIALNEFVNFSPFDISGRYLYDEELVLNLAGADTTVMTKKVEYTLKLILQPESDVQTFSAFGWVANNIGIVRLEGHAVVINFLTGGGLSVSDTSAIATQKLVEYRIGQQ